MKALFLLCFLSLASAVDAATIVSEEGCVPSVSVFTFELEADGTDIGVFLIDLGSNNGPRTTSFLGDFKDFVIQVDGENFEDIYNGIGTVTFDSPYVYGEDRDWVIKFDINGPADVVPEPSVALLGTLGILGCLRRRR